MDNSSNVPLCGEEIFMYPGEPGGMGTLDYTEDDYRDGYPSLKFVSRKHLLDALEDDLETRDVDLFGELEEARFKIPDYQRHYSWDGDDHQRLWYKLLQITQLEYTPGPNPPENFFGTIYVGELQERKRYEVIDGQQRLTTIAIVLECVRRKLEEVIPDLSGDIEELSTHIKEAWIENLLLRQRGMKKVPFLQVSSHDRDFFDPLFGDPESGSSNGIHKERLEKVYKLTGYDGRRKYASTLEEVIDTLEIPDSVVEDFDKISDDDDLTNSYIYFAESHQLLVDAFQYYEESLDDFLDNDDRFPTSEHVAHALINLTLFVFRSFRISEILFTGENKELRVNVFQELNDAGKPLTTKDKIKARIVSLFQQSGSYSVEDELETWSEIVERFADKSERVEEFLVTYVQATRNPDGAKHARDNLLDLFRLTDVGGHEFTPQLTSDSGGHEFLQELDRYSKRFVEIEDLSLTGGAHSLDDDIRKRSEEILRRLTNLNTTQWIPFVLYLYDDVSSIPGKGEFLQNVLETVESLIFRVSLSEVRTTVIESTFMESAAEFREAKERDDIDEPYTAESVSKLVLRNVEENRKLTGETLVDTIVRSRGWGE
ncbi:DUF262 domain-containing protein [Halapricum desulfuricans]|uniref:ParB-like nuclease domain containing protein fused to HNH nuclease n=1 Tax=Halapricum desulfuricans TaxID=2841257 RepID=A0A897NN99_9EURY|nr:DUF262 domain-containing protein [Halapricum desulfuricans]QSG13731.1 ParB-like nuclease domain containing protein fused to HNH nuclease [Halapricum desulfuricans]